MVGWKFVFKLRHARIDSRLQVAVDVFGDAPPVLEVGIAGAAPGAHGSAVNRLRKPGIEFFLETRSAPGPANDLCRYVAPVDTDQFCH